MTAAFITQPPVTVTVLRTESVSNRKMLQVLMLADVIVYVPPLTVNCVSRQWPFIFMISASPFKAVIVTATSVSVN